MRVSEYLVTAADWAALGCFAACAAGCLYALAAVWAARGFLRSATTAPATAYPAVTILKPLHGMEPDLYAHLAGFCDQDYPSPVQIVFGVDDADDPAVATVRQLIAHRPDCDISLAVDGRRHGANNKVSNLVNMAEQARYDVLVVSDSDIVVERDYLKTIMASLAGPGVGLVTCLYRGAPVAGSPQYAWSRFAAAAIDYHFLPSVLVGLKFGLAAPCFGSTMALRRQTLERIGGFAAIADQLADDYALGALVRRAGLAVAMPPMLVAHACSERSAGEFFRHELRWARTIRSVDPFGYSGLALTHALPLALIGLLFGAIAGDVVPAMAVTAAALICRFTLQLELDRLFRLRDDVFWMGPVRDILSFVVFVASFFGRGVEWRGQRYGLEAGNKLVYYGEAKS